MLRVVEVCEIAGAQLGVPFGQVQDIAGSYPPPQPKPQCLWAKGAVGLKRQQISWPELGKKSTRCVDCSL